MFLTVIEVSPAVMWLNLEGSTVENSKSVDNVCAEGSINVARKIFAVALPVPGPIGEVAHNLVRTAG
jgi:hypothetical protein